MIAFMSRFEQALENGEFSRESLRVIYVKARQTPDHSDGKKCTLAWELSYDKGPEKFHVVLDLQKDYGHSFEQVLTEAQADKIVDNVAIGFSDWVNFRRMPMVVTSDKTVRMELLRS